MSVGGKVVETIVFPDRVWVNTREPHSGDECAIYVAMSAEARCIDVGDSLWWQGRWAMWTPRTGSFRDDPPFSDRRLARIGYSGISREQALRDFGTVPFAATSARPDPDTAASAPQASRHG